MRDAPYDLEGSADILRALIRIRSDTGSDMGPVVDYSATLLEQGGLEVRRYGFKAEAPCLVARYRQHGGEGPRPLLVLACHLDTAGFDESQWRVDPLGAAVVKDRVFGRGALDCKGLAALWMGLLLRYAREGRRFPFDLAFAASTDEECEGGDGIKALLANTDEFAGAFLALGEGGGFPITRGDCRYYTVQTGEMGEIPLGDEASAGLRRPWLELLSAFSRGAFTWETLAFALLHGRGHGNGRRLEHSPLSLRIVEGERVFRARSRCSVERHRADGGPGGWVEAGAPGAEPATLRALRHAIRSVDSGARPLPLVTQGRSDNRHFRLAGIPALGFFPLDAANALSGMHGPNEYVSLASLDLAERMLDALIRGLADEVEKGRLARRSRN